MKTIFWTLLLSLIPCTVDANDENLKEKIEKLAGKEIESERAESLARIILEESREADLDPSLIVALIMRESRFSKAVEVGRIRGSRGELGLMQLHPRGPAVKRLSCNPLNPACNIRGGIRYLARVRERCGGDTWQWVAAYQSNHCPTKWEARRASVKRVRKYYCAISSTCRESWPL